MQKKPTASSNQFLAAKFGILSFNRNVVGKKRAFVWQIENSRLKKCPEMTFLLHSSQNQIFH